MPRPNADRKVFAESHLAQRIKIEREARGWSLEGLAKRMSDNGCAIAPSAIYKIEKGDPPRRITVDELVALTRVFGLSMAELVVDPSGLLPERAAELIEKITLHLIASDVAEEAMNYARGLADEWSVELEELLRDNPSVEMDETLARVHRDRIVSQSHDIKPLLAKAAERISERISEGTYS